MRSNGSSPRQAKEARRTVQRGVTCAAAQAAALSLPSLSDACAVAVRRSLGRRESHWSSLSSVAVLMAANLLPCSAAWAQTVPAAQARVPTTALPSGLTQKSGTPLTYSAPVVDAKTGRTTATLKQLDAVNIADWRSFDIGSSAQLNIVQPTVNSVLLNKVAGGVFGNKTVIDGVLNANGRVYLYNPNGIIFGKTGTVNVNTLIASTLKFDEVRVVGGLLRQGSNPVLGAAAEPGRRPGSIVVEGDASQSAQITSANGGLLLLAAPEVTNGGSLKAPDGQVILAAGQKVYLAAPDAANAGLRGLLVEVSNADAAGLPLGTSTAENATSGRVDVGRGNATMIGYAVNQKGRVSATTSVTSNGTVYLYARDQAEPRVGVSTATPVPLRTGPLVLGPGSVTEVLPSADSSEKIPSTTAFTRSQVRLNGESITMQQDASIKAPGGDALFLAERPSQDTSQLPSARTDSLRVDFAAGSVVDVSGSHDAVLSMESNVITAELRGIELADNVVLRESKLFGAKLQVDVRKGTPVADVSGYVAQRQFGVSELNTKGGTVSVIAGSAIIQRPGSEINVDGGWVDFASGYVNTSQLQLGNSLVDVAAAKAGVAYTGVVNLPNSSANFEAGYRQGSSAGTVSLSAPIIVAQGTLSGQVERGPRQRDPAGAGYPLGGALDIGRVGSDLGGFWSRGGQPYAEGYASQFRFEGQLGLGAAVGAVAAAPLTAPAAGAPFLGSNADDVALASRLDLSTDELGQSGFSRLTLRSPAIEVNEAVELAAGGVLDLAVTTASNSRPVESVSTGTGLISVRAPIAIPGGRFTALASSIDVADEVTIDVAGRWTNDQSQTDPVRDASGNPTGAVVLKGGTVNLNASAVQLGENVEIDVSAGAWANATGRVTRGTAGSIALTSTASGATPQDQAANVLRWGEGLKVSGYGFASGGSLTVLGREVVLGNVTGDDRRPGDLALAPSFFQQGGFTRYDIGGNYGLTLAAGAQVSPRASQWALKADALLQSSGGMSSVASTALYELSGPAQTRATTHLTLRAAPTVVMPVGAGQLRLQAGSSLDLDPGASVNLVGGGRIELYGAIRAPAGQVSVERRSSGFGDLIWFGPTASIRAEGSLARLYTDAAGVSSGEVLDGGSIRIGGPQQLRIDGTSFTTSAQAAVVMAPGAVFTVAGASAGQRAFRFGGGVTSAAEVGGSGGSIEISSSRGLELYGSLYAGAGGSSAKGGNLSVTLETDNTAVLDVVALKSVNPRANDLKTLIPDNYDGVSGTGLLVSDSVNSTAFGRVQLRSSDAIAFGLDRGAQTLAASESLVLDASTLLSDSGVKADVKKALFNVAMKELRDADRASDIDRTDEDRAPFIDAVVADRLVKERLQLSAANKLTLQAPYVQLGNADGNTSPGNTQVIYPLRVPAAPEEGEPREVSPRSALAGNALLEVSAATIDLKGHGATQGFARTTLAAKQDVRLAGVIWTDAAGDSDGTQRGSLWTQGRLELTGAQVYPTTLSDFAFFVGTTTDEGSGSFSIGSSGFAAGTVLSAGGTVTAYAENISQAGRLVAPFGRIELGNTDAKTDAILTKDISYAAGSVTSVAGGAVIPFGVVGNGSVPTASSWSVSLSDGTPVNIVQNPSSSPAILERSLPNKEIVSNAGTISTDSTAVLDLSGGGSMFAYGFTPGRGGSKDVLANGKGVYAILPGFTGSVAPVDGDYAANAGLAAGDAIWLSGYGDLAAGYYTLLPAHYALLDGAYSVKAVAGTRDMSASANTVQTDGSLLVAGKLAQAGSGTRAGRSQGFSVSSGKVIKRQSEFAVYQATGYFADKAKAADLRPPELPTDGGHVVFNATAANSAALLLDGTVKLAGAQKGTAGLADIAALSLEITSEKGLGSSGTVRLSVDQLEAMQASSLSLGGVRETVNGSTELTLLTGQLTLANDAQHVLNAPELLLGATGRLVLASGAAMRAEGANTAATDLSLNGPGALLRASGGGAVDLARTNLGSLGGALEIGRDAVVFAGGALQLDASGQVGNLGSLQVKAGGEFSAAVSRVFLGDAVPASVAAGGLTLDGAALASLSTLSSVSLESRDTPIGVYGSVELGGDSTQDLTLKGKGITRSGESTASALFRAQRLHLQGAESADAGTVSGSALGALSLQANTIELDSGDFALRGFERAELLAKADLLAVGQAGVLSADGTLDLSAARITAANGADATIRANSTLNLSALPAAASSAAPVGFGGRLAFEATDIRSSARVEAVSGQISMTASNRIQLDAGQVSTAGRVVTFADTQAYTPGGAIALTSAQLSLGQGASLDVSATGADAGRLSIRTSGTAAGSTTLLGQLMGAATGVADSAGLAAPAQGRFSLDTQSAGQFGALNDQLNQAGFTQSREFRIRQGDVALAGNDRVVAREVSITADAGSITIGGNAEIDASGAKGGRIELSAREAVGRSDSGRVVLQGGARLLANATAPAPATGAGTQGQGGRVLISTMTANGSGPVAVDGAASIRLESDATAAVPGYIDVSGYVDPNAQARNGANGTVTLRAPRLEDGSDVAVASLKTQIRGSASTVIEGYKVYEGSTISAAADTAGNLDATSAGQMYQDASRFGDRQNRIEARLRSPGAALRAGIEVRSPTGDATGDLTVSVNEFAANAADRGWNLQSWRFADQPVNLTLRAERNLNIIGSISDGFVKPTLSAEQKRAMPVWSLASGASADLRFAGGVDFSSANALAVLAGRGDVRLDFAARTPKPVDGSAIKEAGSGRVTAINPNAPVTVTDAPVALIRTGSGSIDIAAGTDVNLGMAKFYVSAERDERLEQPIIFDRVKNGFIEDKSYDVTLYGASIYTAGVANIADLPSFAVPRNALNTHYGAAAKTLSDANFASNGGAITVQAGRDVNGPQNRSANWTYRAADGITATEADPETGDLFIPAVPGTSVALARVVPQQVNNWLFRQGRSTQDADGNTVFETLADGKTLNTAWWARTDYFDQAIATLGGGDVSVSAGRNVSNLSVSAASNAYVPAAGAGLAERGGGDVTVRAGADIEGGLFYAQKGSANLRADGSVVPGLLDPRGSSLSSESLGALSTVLALGDATASVVAGRALSLESVYNPTTVEQSIFNTPGGGLYAAGGLFDLSQQSPLISASRIALAQYSNFSSYSTDSEVRLTALGSGVQISANSNRLAAAGQWEIPNTLGVSGNDRGKFSAFYTVFPGTLRVAALGGDIRTDAGFALSAAPLGQLELLASGSVLLNNGAASNYLRMLDNDPTALSNALAPRILNVADSQVIDGTSTALEAHVKGGLHALDRQVARIVALQGDVVGDGRADVATSLSIPKATTIVAGRDIVDMGVRLQHGSASDVSVLQAGRDVVDSTQASGAGRIAHVLGGPGRLDILAGGDVDLGNGRGVITRGNLDNVYLPEGGAGIRVVAGAKAPDYVGFVNQAAVYGSVYDLSIASLLPSLDLDKLTPAQIEQVATVLSAQGRALPGEPGKPPTANDYRALLLSEKADLAALDSFVRARKTDIPESTTPENLWAVLRTLPAADQASFLNQRAPVVQRLQARAARLQETLAAVQVQPSRQSELDTLFFASLVETGTAKELKPFDAFVASLFPDAAKPAGGDISNFGSQFKTEQGGPITLYAPAGSVYAGLTLGFAGKNDAEQGIFTVRGGAISGLVKNDFLVNKGRVFTLGGGDITLVSQKANIDAGRGSKTASSAPPPQIRISPDGSVSVDVSSSISGSGIATLRTNPAVPAGDVFAIAPRGVFDAGDAGVRSSGSVTVVAPVVRNADNITATGAISGAQVAVAAPVLAPVVVPASATAKDDEASKAASSATAKSGLLQLTVEALGYGPDGQAISAPEGEEESEEDKKKKKKEKPEKK